MASFLCPTCGGEVPEQLYRRTITCTYCSATHPNSVCLRAGDEVLTHGAHGLELARVTACNGPDEIVLPDARTVKLEDVVPVTPAPPTLDARTAVYRRNAEHWVFTFTATPLRDGQLKVKHDQAAFQDAFFDVAVTLDDVRLDARPPELGGQHVHRTKLGQLGAEVRNDPFSWIFKLAFAAIVVGIAVAAVRMVFFR
ncbi:MAG TPA: hypothetical protein VH143_07835 [Kofleriaceae bacterium]|jgi:hypothetical protein|nr:hypothetical protein [Kofleriaceae bacterium]